MEFLPSELEAINDSKNMKDTYCESCKLKFVDCECNYIGCVREALDVNDNSICKLIEYGKIEVVQGGK